MKPLQIPFSTLLLTASIAAPSVAQIAPDTSLPAGEQSIINDVNGVTQIQGGAQRGANLFHSFEAFSVPQGGAALFDNSVATQNIFSRVTGPGASSIDGLLGANGSANLFFLNPNGILFGPNASINIGGSFVAATAHQIDFADGSSWDLLGEPLLTIATPIGLGLGSTEGSIQVRDSGNTVSASTSPLANIRPLTEAAPTPGLDIRPGQTIALVSGSQVVLEGGLVRAPDGQIDLISAGPGTVTIAPNPAGGLDLQFQGEGRSGDIVLTDRALLDASGARGGRVDLTGGQIRLEDSSLITTGAFVEADPTTSGIRIAGNALSVDGSLPGFLRDSSFISPIQIPRIRAGILSQSAASVGALGPITIHVRELNLENGGAIFTDTFSSSQPSNIEVISDIITIDGFTPEAPPLFSSIHTNTSTTSSISGGDIFINSNQLILENTAHILTTTTGTSDAGNIQIRANEIFVRSNTQSDYIEGKNPLTGIASFSVRLAELPFDGSAGNIDVDTQNLVIESQAGQAAIVSSSVNNGNSGDVSVKASRSITIIGGSGETVGIGTAVAELPDEEIILYGPELVPNTGDAGNIYVQSPSIIIQRLTEGGEVGISASNTGSGRSGNINVNGDVILLLDGGQLLAFTAAGNGGNIRVDADQLILVSGVISSNSRGQGRGGNVDIQTDFLALLDGAIISANAVDDRGGRVFIQANAFLPSNDSMISATSALGPEFEGEVILEVPRNNPVWAAMVPPPEVIALEIRALCDEFSRGSFVVIGSGGPPLSPASAFTLHRGWNPPADIAYDEAMATVEEPRDFTPAQGMVMRPDGLIDFVSYSTDPPTLPQAHCDPISLPGSTTDQTALDAE